MTSNIDENMPIEHPRGIELPFTPKELSVRYIDLVRPEDLANEYDFRNVCRLCATKVPRVIKLFNPTDEKYNLLYIIHKYLPIKVRKSEAMPQGVCEQCASTLLSWHELVRSARIADYMIRCRFRTPLSLPIPTPKPSDTFGTEVTKNGVKYVDVGTDVPELPVQRTCSRCALTMPAKQYNAHLVSQHNAAIYRCEECHSYLDKDDLIFHMDQHAFDRLSDEMKAEYYKNEETILAEEARIDALAQIELDKLREYFRRKEEEEARQRVQAEMQKSKSDNNTNGHESKEIKRKAERASDGTQSTKKNNSKRMSAEDCPERDSEIEISPLKHKKVESKRISDAASSPAKRQRKMRALIAKSGLREKQSYFRDGGNVGDDEVNSPKSSPNTKAIAIKDEFSNKSPKASRTCPICSKQYRASSSYFYHMKYFHKRSRDHECPVCKKKFGTKANLTQHASIHTGAYNLECKKCGKRFKSKPSLYIHEQSHDGPKRWACTQCGRSFRWRTHLARHVTRHAAERAHVCTTCGRGFSVRCDLLRHARTHTADEYHCTTCGLKFAQKRYLQVHVVKKHPEVSPSEPMVTRS